MTKLRANKCGKPNAGPIVALFGLLLCFSDGFAASATSAASAAEASAEALSEQMLQALGGRSRWAGLTTLVNDSFQHRSQAPNTVRARISMDLNAGRWRIETTAPNLHWIRVVDAQSQSGWRLTETGVLEDLPKALLEEDLRWHRGHVYRSIHRIAKRDPALSLKLQDGRLEAYEGKTRLAWFSLSSNGEPYAFGALDDALGTRSGPWRFEQDGLRHPIWVSNASGTWRADLHTLAVNAVLDPELFVRPKYLRGAATLLGAWKGSGSFQSHPVEMNLDIENILSGAFTQWQVKIQSQQNLIFAGSLQTRRDLHGLRGDWRDSTGAQYEIESQLLGDCVVTDWGKGYSKYCLRAADQLQVEDYVRGTARPFAQYALMHQAEKATLLAAAQTPPDAAVTSANTAPACLDPRYREFDFWLGDWQVEANGRVIAYNQITPAQNNCAVHENYQVQGTGYLGQSLNMYDTNRGLWQQTWVDNGGMLLNLTGGRQGAAMVMSGTRQTRKDNALITVEERITWTPKADGTVRQLWQTRNEGSVEWNTTFDGVYRKRQRD
jgi:hypothetical protein